MTSKSLKKVRRAQKLGQDRVITLLDKQGGEIHDQDKITEIIKEIHTKLSDSEKCREYNIPLCNSFVVYKKAFDSVQTHAVLTSLQELGLQNVYIELLKELYTNISMTVHLHKESNKFNIRRRNIRQGDTISPNLFTTVVESLFQRLIWES